MSDTVAMLIEQKNETLETVTPHATVIQAIDKMKTYGIALSGDAERAGLGAMSDARWQEFFDVMSKQGIYPANLDYRAAYTLQFVNKGYALNNQHAAN